MPTLRRSICVLAALLSSFACHAAIYRVGPDGDYATLQVALDAAVLAGGPQSIQVESGLYPGTSINKTINAVQALTITG